MVYCKKITYYDLKAIFYSKTLFFKEEISFVNANIQT